jgi:arginyl-tRNA synthetase
MEERLISTVKEVVESGFGTAIDVSQVQLQKTRKEFEGDITLVVFPLTRITKLSPEETGSRIGSALVERLAEVEGFNVVKGFLNISFSASYWAQQLSEMSAVGHYGFIPKGAHSRNVMVEYSSPNTNKPLHLGHIRNNLLGWSVAEILKANGHEVQKVQIINDRGIHICKSMVAWQRFGNGETPKTTGLKGDKLVGKYYVIFDKKYKEEQAALMADGMDEKAAADNAPIMLEAREMLLRWEADDAEVRQLWATMNGWVYDGFDVTYKRLGVDFDKLYYESDTYLIGKEMVEDGVAKGVFERQEDGSIWCDLTADGLDRKLLLRSDGTAVYMTQDIGTAILRYNDWPQLDQLIYTVGNEQDYHFKVLFLVLKKLGYSWAEACYHLSYGMVDLPSGKMKSREGTVVDADDLMEEMHLAARAQSEEKGKLEGLSKDEAHDLFEMLGLGALKYFILRVDPKKRMMFDPQESIDMQGNTGPFIQYTHARIRSVLRKADSVPAEVPQVGTLDVKERQVLRLLREYPQVVRQAGEEYSPALIANFGYELAKDFNQFYQEMPILKEEDAALRDFRLALTDMTGRVIASAMTLLGIRVPERM